MKIQIGYTAMVHGPTLKNVVLNNQNGACAASGKTRSREDYISWINQTLGSWTHNDIEELGSGVAYMRILMFFNCLTCKRARGKGWNPYVTQSGRNSETIENM